MRGDTWVYTHEDADGQPLYIGVSSDVPRRTRNHELRAPWWPLVARVTTIGPLTGREAFALERQMIWDAQPPNNYRYTLRECADYAASRGFALATQTAESRACADARPGGDVRGSAPHVAPVGGPARQTDPAGAPPLPAGSVLTSTA